MGLARPGSFYPIFPPPADLAGDVNLDVTHQELLRFELRAPDVLILPSKLKHFAKASRMRCDLCHHLLTIGFRSSGRLQIVDSVVTVNPSYLAKASSAGTFCKMAIHPVARTELVAAAERGDEEQEHRVYERARVDLIRI